MINPKFRNLESSSSSSSSSCSSSVHWDSVTVEKSMGKPDKAGRDFLTNENRIGRHDGTASEGPRAPLGAGVPEANAEIQSGSYSL